MPIKNFSGVLEKALIEWRRRQTIARANTSIHTFAKYLGLVSHVTILAWLDKKTEPRIENVNYILPRLEELLGPSVYDDLGLARPSSTDPLLSAIIQNWDQLSLEAQQQISNQIAAYLSQKPALNPNPTDD